MRKRRPIPLEARRLRARRKAREMWARFFKRLRAIGSRTQEGEKP